MRTLDFKDHRRVLGDNRYVYAVVSRRVGGLSIGINLNPDKACNFDCPYCQVDRTIPGGDRRIDLDVLAAELDALLAMVVAGDLWEHAPFNTAAPALRRVGDISFAGDGEPTAAPGFADAVAAVVAVRARYGLEDVRLNLLTNATLFHRDKVRAGLDVLGGRGTGLGQARCRHGGVVSSRRWHDPSSTGCSQTSSAPASHGAIKSMFMLDGVGPTDEEVMAWAERLRAVRAAGGELVGVQVYTVARQPADASVTALERSRLEWIASQAEAVGLEAAVY